jgi:hypothetical protein
LIDEKIASFNSRSSDVTREEIQQSIQQSQTFYNAVEARLDQIATTG